MRHFGRLFALLIAFVALPLERAAAASVFDPPALYLTWQRDPASTMTVHWQVEDEAKTELFFRKSGTADWKTAAGTSIPLPSSARIVHTVELTGLEQDTHYEFCFWPGERRFKFLTAPKKLDRPVRFVTGGDVYHEREWMDLMNELAGKLDPLFVVIGGDLAYSFERANTDEKMERWYAFWDSWKSKALTAEGRLIPMLVTIGNHEARGFYKQTPAQAPAFYAQFSMPGPQGYNVLDFGWLSLLLLDSGITHPLDGAQLTWLERTLANRKKVPHVIPVYHMPAYPSFRPYNEEGGIDGEVRRLWAPVFEKAGIRVAFENHDHAYKRTHPIRDGKIDSKGITYLGDGAWGVRLRKPDHENPRWYIARSDAIRHLFLVTLLPDSRHIMAIDDKGRIFDEVFQKVK
jgi:acid phosphatase type 7